MAKNELSRLRGLLLADVKAREQILDILNKLEEMDLNNTEYIEEISTKLLALNKFSTKEEYEATNNELNNLLLQINELSEINNLIPNTATPDNKLVDKNFLNSSISTATAEFHGTFENLDALKSSSADINDYAFYKHIDENGNTVFDRYKFTDKWEYEYTLNNSSFTAEQWATINSGLTANVLDDLAANTERELEKKVNYTDIVDALNSEETSKPLSAKMGKELKTQVDTKAELQYVNEELNKKASNNQVDEKISGVKGYVDETLTNYPTNSQVDATLENYAKKDGYYETFGYAREAGVAKNLKSDKDKLLDPDVTTSSGVVYADQPFTQRATAMTMKAYLDNELITVGSGYEQWKKEQAFSIVRNQLAPNLNSFGVIGGATKSYTEGVLTVNTITSSASGLTSYAMKLKGGHKYLRIIEFKGAKEVRYTFNGEFDTHYATGNWEFASNIFTQANDADRYLIIAATVESTFQVRNCRYIDLTQWFASRPEIATALNGDEGVKWFLQNYPEALTLGYDEGTIVDTEDYDYETTGVNLWDEEWELGYFDLTTGEPISSSNISRSKNFIKVLPATEYFYKSNNANHTIMYYDANGNYISNKQYGTTNSTFITPQNCCFIKFAWVRATYKNDIQICQHFTETSVEQTYHKYEIFKDRVSWAFTSTGKGKSAGSVADTKDYVNKKNIEKVGQVDLGTLDWQRVQQGDFYRFAASISDIFIPSTYADRLLKCLCSKYLPNRTGYVTYDNLLDKCWLHVSNFFTIRDDSYNDAAAFKAAMSGVILNYELATYIETDMSGDEFNTNIPENDYGVERKVPVSRDMFSGSATTILYQDIVWKQIYNNKSLIDNLRVDVDTLESRIPDAGENTVSTHNTSSTAHSDIRTLVSNAQTAADNAQTKANSAYTLAEGRARGVSFDTEAAMTAALKAAAKTDYKIGDNLFIKATGVPDYWVSNVLSTNSGTYGYFEISTLETQKVDLTNYYTKTETDLKFLSKEEAQNTYATISSVDELSNIINSNRGIIDSIQSEINVMQGSLANVKSSVDEVKNKAQEAYNLALEIDGSPKGVYANLSALQTAFPSGASGVYLTRDNGHWYYWNGSAWTDGGVYQSSEDINQIKSDLVNISNGVKYIDFGWEVGGIDGSGADSTSTAFHRSNYLKCDDIDGFTIAVDGNLEDVITAYEYDENKSYIGRGTRITNTTVYGRVSSRAYYVRFTGYHNDYTLLTISDKIKIAKYIDAVDSRCDVIERDMSNVRNDIITIDLEWEVGTIVNGVESQSNIHHRTDYIEVEKLLGAKFVVTSNLEDRVNMWMYNLNKEYVSRTAYSETSQFNDFATNIAFVRLTAYKEDYKRIRLDGKENDIVSLNKDNENLLYNANHSRASSFNDTTAPLAFVHFSDIHNVPVLWKRMCKYIDTYNMIQFSIHTGDYCGSNQTEYTDLYEVKSASKPILNCVGNHDIINGSGAKQLKETTRALLFNHTDNWGVTFGDDSAMYYYKDFANAKIRLIVLDQYYSDSTEIAWFQNALATAKTNGFSVITASHTQTSEITNKISTFNTPDSFEHTASEANGFGDYIKAFKDNGGKHICHLCGHWHWDNLGYDENGILNVIVECATNYSGGWNNDIRRSGYRSYDCFNVVFADVNTHTIRIVRVGSNTDNYLQAKNVVTIDYESGTLLSNW